MTDVEKLVSYIKGGYSPKTVLSIVQVSIDHNRSFNEMMSFLTELEGSDVADEYQNQKFRNLYNAVIGEIIHYSSNGCNIQTSHHSYCSTEYVEDKTYKVTKDMDLVNCNLCAEKMPSIFSVLHRSNIDAEIAVIANILAKDHEEAIMLTVHFIDNGELKTLDGKGVNFANCKLVKSTTSTFMN